MIFRAEFRLIDKPVLQAGVIGASPNTRGSAVEELGDQRRGERAHVARGNLQSSSLAVRTELCLEVSLPRAEIWRALVSLGLNLAPPAHLRGKPAARARALLGRRRLLWLLGRIIREG